MALDSTDTHAGTGSTGLVSGLAKLTLEVHDLDEAERFYGEAIGLRLLSRERDRTWLAVGDTTRLGLWAPGTDQRHRGRGGRHK